MVKSPAASNDHREAAGTAGAKPLSIASMTGFARGAGNQGDHAWVWEARSVNGRGLDVRVRVPPGYDALEQPARADAVEHADLAHAPGLAESRDAAQLATVHRLIGGKRGQADDETDPSRRPRRPLDRPE